MDFIERWFGISPDGGNGVLEAMYFVAVLALVCIVFRRHIALLLYRLKYHGKPD